MRILTVNCVNDIYSTGKLIASIENYTEDMGCEYYHCYEMGNKPVDKHQYRISGNFEYKILYMLSRLLGRQYDNCRWATVRLCKRIREYCPDIVHIHCPNAKSVNLFYLLRFLKNGRYCTVITNHAEFFYTGNCAHAFECKGYLDGCISCKEYRSCTDSLFFNRTRKSWKKMRQAFKQYNKLIMVAVSPWAKERIETSTIAKGIQVRVIKNGINTEKIFYHRIENPLRDKYKEDKILLHVTSNFSAKLNDAKGGYYILELAKRLKHVKIIVIGPCEDEELKVPENVQIMGTIEDQHLLAEYYSSADITVMTSKRETYGLTCAESLCCGTPVVGFKNGGTETIALQRYSYFVDYGNIDALVEAVELWIDKKRLIYEEVERNAKEEYSERKMAMEYYRLYNQMLEK